MRVWIVGPSGSGKSTAAARVGAVLGVAPVHLDDLHWTPGWVERSQEDLIERLREPLSAGTWVVEGNYAWARRHYLDRIDFIVWLDLPRRRTVPRVVRRTLRRALFGEPCCNGNRESMRKALLSRDSIVLWALTSHRRYRRAFEAELPALAHVRLRTPREVDAWLRAFAADPSLAAR